MAAEFPAALRERLTASLTRGAALTFHYVQSQPAACDPIFASAPGQQPEPTAYDSHFLSSSAISTEPIPAVNLAAPQQTSEQAPIGRPSSEQIVNGKNEAAAPDATQQAPTTPQLVQIFALEVIVYTTPSLTTVFVSKADSTGLMGAAQLPQGGRSVVKKIAQAFLSYLLEAKRQPGRRLVLSLFARSQAQYLFPGSIENAGKHVLDDRQLIKWWCGIVDGVLGEHSNPTRPAADSASATKPPSPPEAYLTVPGLEAYEARTYWPRAPSVAWHAADPLRQIAPSLNVPPRCLVPRFPDDPKARFALDLDEELPENGPQPANSPVKNPPGNWRSVRSLEQFWELMAFRQECSAGRVVGFLWGVFELEGAEELEQPGSPTPAGVQGEMWKLLSAEMDSGTPVELIAAEGVSADGILTDAVPTKPEQPGEGDTITEAATVDCQPPQDGAPVDTVAVSLPLLKAEALDVDSAVYSEVTDLLEQLDYAGLGLAAESTRRFVAHAAHEAHVQPVWGVEIKGEMEVQQPVPTAANGAAGVNMLNSSFIRKRKKVAPAEDQPEEKKAKVEA